jgi:hypothetical protein
MSTKVYGASDDLVEFEGDVYGEVGYYTSEELDAGMLVIFSDGTILEAKYGKAGLGVWGLNVLAQGPLFQEHVACADEDADPHSDVVTFKDGLKWAYAATEWERVR